MTTSLIARFGAPREPTILAPQAIANLTREIADFKGTAITAIEAIERFSEGINSAAINPNCVQERGASALVTATRLNRFEKMSGDFLIADPLLVNVLAIEINHIRKIHIIAAVIFGLLAAGAGVATHYFSGLSPIEVGGISIPVSSLVGTAAGLISSIAVYISYQKKKNRKNAEFEKIVDKVREELERELPQSGITIDGRFFPSEAVFQNLGKAEEQQQFLDILADDSISLPERITKAPEHYGPLLANYVLNELINLVVRKKQPEDCLEAFAMMGASLSAPTFSQLELATIWNEFASTFLVGSKKPEDLNIIFDTRSGTITYSHKETLVDEDGIELGRTLQYTITQTLDSINVKTKVIDTIATDKEGSLSGSDHEEERLNPASGALFTGAAAATEGLSGMRRRLSSYEEEGSRASEAPAARYFPDGGEESPLIGRGGE